MRILCTISGISESPSGGEEGGGAEGGGAEGGSAEFDESGMDFLETFVGAFN